MKFQDLLNCYQKQVKAWECGKYIIKGKDKMIIHKTQFLQFVLIKINTNTTKTIHKNSNRPSGALSTNANPFSLVLVNILPNISPKDAKKKIQ